MNTRPSLPVLLARTVFFFAEVIFYVAASRLQNHTLSHPGAGPALADFSPPPAVAKKVVEPFLPELTDAGVPLVRLGGHRLQANGLEGQWHAALDLVRR